MLYGCKLLLVLGIGASVYCQQQEYAQCGGIGYTGGTTCASPYVCSYVNAYYSQCLPATGSATTTTSHATPTTVSVSSTPVTSSAPPSSATNWIVSGANWTDTSGNRIQAHGAGIIKVGSLYYMFGEDKSQNNQNFLGVSCYHSSDLATWTKCAGGDVLTSSSPGLSSSIVVERPKVIYNSANAEYVMYFHYDDTSYSVAQVGVATSKTIDSGWTFLGHFSPLGYDSRDMGLFQDTDGSAYLLYASDNNADFKISQLTSDYHNVSSQIYEFAGVRYEAGGMFKRNGLYYLLVSHQSGWSPNPNKYLTASSLSGPWSAEADLAPEATNTYSSQNTYDLAVTGSSSTTYIYIGDRWRSDVLGSSTYLWYPLTFNGNAATIQLADVWTVNVATGTYSAILGTTYTTTSSTTTASPAYISGGMVRYLGEGGSVTFNNVSASGTGSYWLSIYSSNGDSTYRTVTVSVNGGTKYVVPQPPTGGGTNVISVPVQVQLNSGNYNMVKFEGTSTTYAADLQKFVVY